MMPPGRGLCWHTFRKPGNLSQTGDLQSVRLQYTTNKVRDTTPSCHQYLRARNDSFCQMVGPALGATMGAAAVVTDGLLLLLMVSSDCNKDS